MDTKPKGLTGNTKTLHLSLKKKWFDMIDSGEKTEEYREIKQYWSSRLLWHEYAKEVTCINSLKDAIHQNSEDPFGSGVFRKHYEFVEFRNGYAKNAPTITVECLGITYGEAKPEWSDNWQGDVFIIKLGKVLVQPETEKG
jgi:hypothetical protein